MFDFQPAEHMMSNSNLFWSVVINKEEYCNVHAYPWDFSTPYYVF